MMRVRAFACGLLVVALITLPVVTRAQTAPDGDERRPGLPTFFGDTGLWFVPTAETLPERGVSFSVFRANFDRRQGLTDVSNVGLSVAFGVTDRVEVFGSWRAVRLDRDVRPTFVTGDTKFGGVPHDYPFVRGVWSGTVAAPLVVGGKFNLLSQSRADAMSLAPRVMLKLPTGSRFAGTEAVDLRLDMVASGEISERVEVTGTGGVIIRSDPDEFRLSNGVAWGVGAGFPSRSPLRALVELQGEFLTADNTEALSAIVAEDGSVAPRLSANANPVDLKLGAVWQSSPGWFVHGGMNYSLDTGGRRVGGFDISHGGWEFDLRVGLHPGVKRYVPPPPPPPPPAPAPVAAAPPPPPPPPPPAPAPAPPPPPPTEEVFVLADVYFDFDMSVIREDARAVLQENAAYLNRLTSVRVTIEGHADSRGTNEYNLALAERRAVAVRDYLVSLGIAANRMLPITLGEEMPQCREENETCWQLNRRGAFVITAK